jgi:hypothetical protein
MVLDENQDFSPVVPGPVLRTVPRLVGKIHALGHQMLVQFQNKFKLSDNFIGCELTGDTVLFGRGVWGDAKSSNIM